MSTHTYRTLDVPVDGGALRAGIWEPVDGPPGAAGDVPTVLAVHGITATHMSWMFLPEHLPGWRIVAPDLRGRGRSNDLPGPYGIQQHAADLADLLAAQQTGPVTVLGHSMGAFVAVELACRAPTAVRETVLIDGGIPIEVPNDADPADLAQAVLRPALDRLSMTFADRAGYRSFWADHPAFDSGLRSALAGYFDYDLEPTATGWRPSAHLDAVAADQRELLTDRAAAALTSLAQLPVPLTFIHAPRGLLDDAPFYRPGYLTAWARRLPSLRMVWASDVNHYTVVMSAPGARLVAQQLAPATEGVQ